MQLSPTLTSADGLSGRMRETRHKFRCLIEDAEAHIRTRSTTYEMKYVECHLCARRHPLDAKKCHSCRNTELRQLYCTPELRISSYMEVLRRAGLWGSSTPLESLAAADIQLRMIRAGNDMKHICEAGQECPLKVDIRVVNDGIKRLIDDSGSLELQELAEEGGVSVREGSV